MKVTLIQMDIKWGDIAANCNTASQLIDSAPGSDLYVLPEMFSTGFATKPEDIADDTLASLRWMQRKATDINAAICGSVATRCDDGTYRNRMYFCKPENENDNDNVNDNDNENGSLSTEENEYRRIAALSPRGGERGERLLFYDKRHLFTYGGEHLHYTAGNERVVVEWRGVRFLLQVCYDLRFPVFSRNTPSDAYDAAIYVASWPTTRIEVWRTLLKARAIENQCYVFGVDRVGEDPQCSYCGGTESIDPYGRVVAACPDNTQGTITTIVDMEKLTAFRKKFPVLEDGDIK